MRQKRTAEELKGTELECYLLLKDNQKAVDDNTEWVIEFYAIKTSGYFGEDLPEIMRAYPPESLTKYRRNLVSDGLIFPSEKSIQHSREMEAQNHSQAKEIHDQISHRAVSNCLFPNQNPLI